MWSLSSSAHRSSEQIHPIKRLYEYDGPLIFTAMFGFVEAFFVKFDEVEGADFYVVAQTDENTVDLIERGQTSVRSGLDRDFYWIVEAQKSMTVSRYWVCPRYEFPEEYMPEKNVAIRERFGLVPNSVAQLQSFFSVDYQGINLRKSVMKFSLFKQLVDNTHEAVRNILSPIVLLGSKTATFDFNISEPVFSSLVISIQTPTVNQNIVQKKIKKQDVNISDVQEQFSAQRDNFFVEMEELISQADKGAISDALIEERFSLLDRIQGIIPTEDNHLSSVMFSANQGNKFSHLFVSDKTGGILNKAFREAESRPVEEVGTVEVSNDPSRSFVLMSRRGKQVTCYVTFENYEELKIDPRFRNGVAIKARGRLTRRPRRDILHVEGLPTLTA